MDPLNLWDAAREAPSALAVLAGGEALSYAELAARAASFAAHLRGDPRAPIAFVARPTLGAIVAGHALLARGTPMVLMHPRWS
ncbi:MAG: hypothetical protein U0271_43165 [Polyangiaceae bacterium]